VKPFVRGWQMQKGSSSVKSPVTVWRARSGIPCKGGEFRSSRSSLSGCWRREVVEYRPVFSDVDDGLFAQFARDRGRTAAGINFTFM